MKDVTIQEVLHYREEHKCSLNQARKGAARKKALSLIERARAFDSVKDLCDAVELMARSI